MELRDLLSGIAVVIDDKIEEDRDENADRILKIVNRLEQEWNLPFYKAKQIPPKDTWPNLLQAASFILLDWKLWPPAASEQERDGIEKNIEFIRQAKDCFVPVLIFTNEDPEDIKSKLPDDVYQEETAEKSFVFVQRKEELLHGDELDSSAIERWVKKNASVYALKTWERVFHAAKKNLFSSMYARSPDWPKVFWKAYREDDVDPSSSLTHLINDNLRGRMRTDAFEAEILDAAPVEVPRDELRALIGEVSFRKQDTLPKDEVGCGDLFRLPKGKFLLNIRPECDCIARDEQDGDDVDVYCVEGKTINDRELHKLYQNGDFRNGHFNERVWESIEFCIHERKSIRFDFRKLHVTKFSELKSQRIGRLLHPYLTRIQQRYALYLQRQGLPRIPEAAVSPAPRALATR